MDKSWIITGIVSVLISFALVAIGYLDGKRIMKRIEKEEDNNIQFTLYSERAEVRTEKIAPITSDNNNLDSRQKKYIVEKRRIRNK